MIPRVRRDMGNLYRHNIRGMTAVWSGTTDWNGTPSVVEYNHIHVRLLPHPLHSLMAEAGQ
ncbi:hypothetical protein FGU65_08360 [Methanoculleus sp. FWC-SCC1]|uniref:Uncharacterized protein n=1 Tax=Methanoculleus frigidifontis TaxID=2584085 RepID=A0ABT8MAH2_9EURY|nr:hypothetical protein [Methanoculleus sp. FWC-SCC1]MDN7024899.1 hypothetical protein [Methanoculleus sp. FWC-SCC1]